MPETAYGNALDLAKGERPLLCKYPVAERHKSSGGDLQFVEGKELNCVVRESTKDSFG